MSEPCLDNRSYFDCNWPNCGCILYKEECADARDVTPTLFSIMPLYQAIKHGSAAHRQWLWDAFVAWSRDEEVPEPYE